MGLSPPWEAGCAAKASPLLIAEVKTVNIFHNCWTKRLLLLAVALLCAHLSGHHAWAQG